MVERPLILPPFDLDRLMCSLILSFMPNTDWPLKLAVNRDEMNTRPFTKPDHHWPTQPWIFAPQDQQAHGTWIGLNKYGVCIALLNRAGTLGAQQGKRSRGELPLMLLDHATAPEACQAALDLSQNAYRGFNLIIADRTHAYWVRHTETLEIEAYTLPEGISMIRNGDLNDGKADALIRKFLPKFRMAPTPTPETGDWSSWQKFLTPPPSTETTPSLFLQTPSGFETTSTTYIALPASPQKAASLSFINHLAQTDIEHVTPLFNAPLLDPDLQD